MYDTNSKFHSFKKVLVEMGKPYHKMELASFMSCSKGKDTGCERTGIIIWCSELECLELIDQAVKFYVVGF